MIIDPFIIRLPISSLEALMGSKFGVLSLFIGVGTVIMKILQSFICDEFDVNFEF